jgi:sugar-specific transcriptional regulator TrmB
MNTIIPSLEAAGLSNQQAAIYELLLAKGKERASRLVREVPWKRGVVYKILSELVELGLIEETKTPGAVTTFAPKHPLSLKDLAERHEREARDRTLSLESALPSLVSQFNLSIGTPGVQFFEGEAGVEKTLDDSLASGKIIYTYADIEAVMKYIPDINTRYVAKRERLGIDKKALLLDNPFAREYMKTYHRLVTDVKLIPPLRDAAPFHSVMEIYDGKVSYITFEESRMIGVIIDNRAIFDMHKYLFEYLWSLAPKYEPKTPISPPEENKKDSAKEVL